MFKIIFSFIVAILMLFNDYNSTYGTAILFALVVSAVFDKKFKIGVIQIITIGLLVLSYLFSGIQTQSIENTTLLILLVAGLGNFHLPKKYKDQFFKISTVFLTAISVYQFARNGIAHGVFFNIYDLKQIYPNSQALLSLMLIASIEDKRFAAANFLTILLTRSRIGIVFAAIVFCLKNLKTLHKRSKTFVTSALVAILLVVPFIHKSNQTTHFGSFQQRVEHWNLTPKLFDYKTLLVGQGAGSFQYLFPTVQQIPLNNAPHSHNIILNWLLEYGVWITGLLMLLLAQSYTSSNSKSKLALAAFFAFNMVNLDIQFPLMILFLLILSSDYIPKKSLKHAKYILLPLFLGYVLVVSNNSFINQYISHKDYWIRQNQIQNYLNDSSLDLKALRLTTNPEKYAKQIFLSDPLDINSIAGLVTSEPKVVFNQTWYNNMQSWYLKHVQYNHSFINDNGQTQTLINAMQTYDPSFAAQLQTRLELYRENSLQNSK